jgi:hypothetical protein
MTTRHQLLLVGSAMCFASGGAIGAQQWRSLTPSEAQAAVNGSSATTGRWWVEVTFPALELRRMGCPQPGIGPRRRERPYLWRLIARFRDAKYPEDHFMQIGLQFWLPDSVRLTPARLSRALRSTSLEVDELKGEPQQSIGKVAATHAVATWHGGRVKFRVEGETATRAFLRARSDSLTLAWCQRDLDASYIQVPLVHR